MIQTFNIDLSQIMSIPQEINQIARIETQQMRATANLDQKFDGPKPLRATDISGRVKRARPARARIATSFAENEQ